jgi:hypothetical protein
MKREMSNLKHIVAKKPCKNPAHRKAVTESSFELLSRDVRDVSELSGLWNVRIRRDARKLIDLADQRDAAGVLAVIEQLKPRLEKKTRGMNVQDGDACQF